MEDAAIGEQGEREKQNISRHSKSNGRTVGMKDSPAGRAIDRGKEGLTMAITNGEIILRESLELLKHGVLKPTGRVFVQELPDGSKVELPEPEPIHTYNGWKDLGYQVKKGEHAKAQFPIWKYKGQKNEETGEEENGKCYQRKAFWFTFDQVEKAVSA